jgi:hypothetical protein
MKTMKKSVPEGLLYWQAVKKSGNNRGAFDHKEIILHYIQQERPYLNTGATAGIFKIGVKSPVDFQYPRGPPDQRERPNQPMIFRKYKKS